MRATAAQHDKRLLVIVADRIGMHDWASDTTRMPNLRKAEKIGALGLMVTKTEMRDSESAAHATLGAGLSSANVSLGALGYDADEPFSPLAEEMMSDDTTAHISGTAADEHDARTGMRHGRTKIVNLGIGPLVTMNAETDWQSRPGALGDALRAAHITTSVIGNSDFYSDRYRYATVIAMDSHGRVDRGLVGGSISVPDASAPGGLALNIPLLHATVLDELRTAGFVIVDFGDTSRADRFTTVATPEGAFKAQVWSLRRLDAFIGFILKNVDLTTTQVIVLSPTPHRGASQIKMTLTPILVFGNQISGAPAMLVSNSTKRDGIVINTDFAPHVCSYFGIKSPADFVGAPFAAAKHKDALTQLVSIHDRDAFVENQMPLLKKIIIWLLIVLIACVLTTIRMDRADLTPSHAFLTAISWALMISCSMFLSFLLISGFPAINTPVLFPTTFILVSFLIATMMGMFRTPHHSFIFLSATYIAVIIIDQLAGGPLIKHSVLSYYPQMGARFYGIGNEFEGIMVSAPVILTGLLLDARREWEKYIKPAAALLMAFCLYIIGSPSIGADFGGILSCSVAYIAFAILLYADRINWKSALLGLTVIVLLVAATVFVDAIVLGGKSHMGQLVARMIHDGNADEFTKVVFRKLATNIRLLQVSSWSMLFIAAISISLLFHFFPAKTIKRIFERYPFFEKAYMASIYGGLAAFALNDSGIVPGAISIILSFGSLFLLIFNTDFNKPIQAKTIKPIAKKHDITVPIPPAAPLDSTTRPQQSSHHRPRHHDSRPPHQQRKPSQPQSTPDRRENTGKHKSQPTQTHRPSQPRPQKQTSQNPVTGKQQHDTRPQTPPTHPHPPKDSKSDTQHPDGTNKTANRRRRHYHKPSGPRTPPPTDKDKK